MTVLVALLRAVNVGGRTSLPMERLRAVCVEIGFERVKTYVQSGNVVFASSLKPEEAGKTLEEALTAETGNQAEVLVRTADEVRAIEKANPYPDEPPAKVGVLFLAAPLGKGELAGITTDGRERWVAVESELYIHFPDGMGRTKLKLPKAARGTMRNMNTVAKLAAMAGDAESVD